jgi:hypothetical protein
MLLTNYPASTFEEAHLIYIVVVPDRSWCFSTGPNRVERSRMAAQTLVVYYSRTGRTRALAETLAAELDADIEEIREPGSSRSGILGFLRSGLAALRGVSAEIAPRQHDSGAYALVVIGGPVWLHRPSSPVRAYLSLECERLPRTAYFATYDWMGADAAIERMSAVTRQVPLARLAVRRADLARDTIAPRITCFTRCLLAEIAPPTPASQG